MKKCLLVIVSGVVFINNVYVYGGSLRITANPCPRTLASMITDSLNNRIILFGGGNYRLPWGQNFNDVWSLDFATETWQPLTVSGTIPSPRREVAAVYHFSSNSMILFGGRDGTNFFNEVWSFNLNLGSETWTQITPSGTPPSPRASATGIIDPINNRLIIFGGYDQYSGLYNETWSLDLTSFSWLLLSPSGTPPSQRWEHSAIYDPSDHRMVVFGGNDGSQYLNDIWILDLAYGSENWSQLSISGGPSEPRGRHFAVFDDISRAMIIGFGYYFQDYFFYHNDAWLLDFNLSAWRRILPVIVGIEGRRGICASLNTLNREVIIFGGDQYYDYYFGDTYSLTTDTLAINESKKNEIFVMPYIKIFSNPTLLPCQLNVFVPFPNNINLKVYDAAGRFVNTLIHEKRNSGNYIIEWDGKDRNGMKVEAGVYFFKLDIDGKSVSKKVVIVE